MDADVVPGPPMARTKRRTGASPATIRRVLDPKSAEVNVFPRRCFLFLSPFLYHGRFTVGWLCAPGRGRWRGNGRSLPGRSGPSPDEECAKSDSVWVAEGPDLLVLFQHPFPRPTGDHLYDR